MVLRGTKIMHKHGSRENYVEIKRSSGASFSKTVSKHVPVFHLEIEKMKNKKKQKKGRDSSGEGIEKLMVAGPAPSIGQICTSQPNVEA